MKKIVFFLVIVLVLLTGCTKLDSDMCTQKGGRIVNTLEDACMEDEVNIGEVEGLRCPCICCVPS